MALKTYTNVVKGLKLKVRIFQALIPAFVEVTEEKLAGGAFPIVNRIKTLCLTIFPKKAELQFLEIYFLVVILRIWLRFGILTKP